MQTLILTLDRLDEVQPGDRLVAIDDIKLSAEKVLTDGPRRLWPNGPIGIPFEHGGVAPAYLYPDSLVERSITVERDGPYLGNVSAEARQAVLPEPGALGMLNPYAVADEKPEPAPMPAAYWDTRERNAIRRNPQYEATLRLLDVPGADIVDLRACAPRDGIWLGARYYSHQAGILARWYGWTERVADYTWRLTPAGRRVLALLDQRKG